MKKSRPAARRRVVAVTGGSRGIGRAIADLFVKMGDQVAVCARGIPKKKFPSSVMFRQVDVQSRFDQRAFVEAVVKKFSRLDVFINCAGVSRWMALSDIDESFAQRLLATNVFGTLWGCQAAASFMKKGGSIINVSSLAGKRGSANNSVYCASKFAVNGLTQALAKELGPRQIRVNAVCPVYIETDTILASLEDPAAPPAGKPVGSYLKEFALSQAALQRLPTAQDVSDAVYYLASEQASAVTGQCINVDCGVLPQ